MVNVPGEMMQNSPQANTPAPPDQPRMAHPAGAAQGQGTPSNPRNLRPGASGPQTGPSTTYGMGTASVSSPTGPHDWYRPPGRQVPLQGNLSQQPMAQGNYPHNHQPHMYYHGGAHYPTPYPIMPPQWPGYPTQCASPDHGYYRGYTGYSTSHGYSASQNQQEHICMPFGGNQVPTHINPSCPSHGHLAQMQYYPHSQGQHGAAQSVSHPQMQTQYGTVQTANQQGQTLQAANQNLSSPPAQAQHGTTQNPCGPQAQMQGVSQGPSVPKTHAQQSASQSLSPQQTHAHQGATQSIPGPQNYPQQVVAQGASVQQTHAQQGAIQDFSPQHTHVQQAVRHSPSIQPTEFGTGQGMRRQTPEYPKRFITSSRPVNPTAPEFQPAQFRPAGTAAEQTVANVCDQNTSVGTLQPPIQGTTVEYFDIFDEENTPLKEPFKYDASYRHAMMYGDSVAAPGDKEQEVVEEEEEEEEDEEESETEESELNASTVESKSTNHMLTDAGLTALTFYPFQHPLPGTFNPPNVPAPEARPSNVPPPSRADSRDSAFADWTRQQVTSYLMNARESNPQSPALGQLLRDPNGLLSNNFWAQANNPPQTISSAYQISQPELVATYPAAPALISPVPQPPGPRQLEALVNTHPLSFVHPAESVLGIKGSPNKQGDQDASSGPPSPIADPCRAFENAPPPPVAPIIPSTQTQAENRTRLANGWFSNGLDASGIRSGTLGGTHGETEQSQQLVDMFRPAFKNLASYATRGYSNYQAPPPGAPRVLLQSEFPQGRIPAFREPEPDFSTLERRRHFLNNACLVPYMGPPCTGDPLAAQIQDPFASQRHDPFATQGHDPFAPQRHDSPDLTEAIDMADGSHPPVERRRHRRL